MKRTILVLAVVAGSLGIMGTAAFADPAILAAHGCTG